MSDSACFFVASFLFLFLFFSELKAGEIPPPDTIGACCLTVGPDVCQEISLEDCLSAGDGIGWSDELSCQPDTCIPDTEGSEDCCSIHAPTGCEDLTCTETICEIDPYCCIFDWDDICVDEAFELCPDVCVEVAQGPTVIVPTLTQWGMIFTVFIVGLSAVIRLRINEDSET